MAALGASVKTRIRNLRDLAKVVNEARAGYTAKVESWTTNTDTKIAGTRLRRPGRGRKGLRIYVYKRNKLVLDHCNSETYRHTFEAVDKVVELIPTLKNKLDVRRPWWAK